MNAERQISVLKIFQTEEKFLINGSEDPDMKNATLDTERSQKQVLF